MYLNDIFIRIKYVHYKYPTMSDVLNSDEYKDKLL